MDEQGATPRDPGSGRAGGVPEFPVSTWVGVAVIGALVFAVGIWTPVWKGIPDGVAFSYSAAAGGAALFIVGLTFAERTRRAMRSTPIEEFPGVEVYRPGTVATREPEDKEP